MIKIILGLVLIVTLASISFGIEPKPVYAGATVELDKKVYTWTDEVYIIVVAPGFNSNPNLIDTIVVSVSTSGHILSPYKLVETGTNTGIFTGKVTLDGTGNVSGITSGIGSTDGLIDTLANDTISVSFEFAKDQTVTGSALVRSSTPTTPPQPISPETTVTTDKTSYTSGDIIHFSGTTVSSDSQNVYVTIYDPNNKFVLLTSGIADSNHRFQIMVDTGSQDNKQKFSLKGTYGATAFITNQASGKTVSFVFSPDGSPVVSSPTPTITVSTDRTSYNDGDQLNISGTLSDYIAGKPVSVIVRDPIGHVVQIAQVDLGSDRKYSTTIAVGGNSLWQSAGTYEVDVQFGSADISAKTTFQFAGSNGGARLIHPISGVSSDGSEQVIVTYSPSPPTNGQPLSITLTFTDAQGNPIKHQNYAISVTQDGNEIFSNTAGHTHTGNDMQVTNNLVSSNPADIRITLNGIGLPGTDPSTWTGPKGDVIYFPNMGGSGSQPTQPNENTPIPISVSTDKTVYDHNSIIMVSGHVRNPLGQDVGMKVISPSGNAVSAAQLTVDSNGDYTTKLNTTNSLWTENGVYTIYVQQGDMQDRTSKVQVEITSELPPQITPTNSQPQYATPQDLASINDARNNQTIAAEVNVGANQSTTTSIDNNVSVQTIINNPDSLESKVTAPDQTGPKVIMFNLPATTINVANLKDLGVMYDGKLISPAPNMDAILHAKSTDSPSFAIVVTQSGVQVLVLIPHFSTHTITITNMTKVIPAVPEFGSLAGMIIITSMIGVLTISRKFRFHF